MRLRPLTEAECYARCYGGFRTDQVSLLLPGHEPDVTDRGASAQMREPAATRGDGQRREAA
jgi:hypothetical protein